MDNQTQQPAAPTSNPAQPAPQQPAPAAPAAPQAAPGSPTTPAPKKSSKLMLLMVILTLVVLVVAAWFGYSYFMNKSSESLYQSANNQQRVAPTAGPTPTAGPVKSGDAQLDGQSSAIDESMQKVEDDVKGVDTGLNDQSVNLN